MKSRTLVIGDIHGAYKALLQVLERSSFNKELDQLIFLGDYCDGWSETVELIDYLIELNSICTHKPIFIEGNHDTWLKNFLNWGASDYVWLENGGKITKKTYIKKGKNLSEEHRNFFNSLIRYYHDSKNRLFVHGGFDIVNGRLDFYDCTWDRSLWDRAMSNKLPEIPFDEVYIGHTATENFKVKPHYPEYKDVNQPKQGGIIIPMNRDKIWNLDTGAGWNGKLTIMDIDTKEYWQSDYSKELYKDEKGRF